MMPTAERTVPCKWCGKLTPMTGTRMCDQHWELESRIAAEPRMATYMLECLRTGHEPDLAAANHPRAATSYEAETIAEDEDAAYRVHTETTAWNGRPSMPESEGWCLLANDDDERQEAWFWSPIDGAYFADGATTKGAYLLPSDIAVNGWRLIARLTQTTGTNDAEKA